MFYDKEIKILQTSPGTIDDDGIYHAGTESTLKTISCDVQPYSRDRLYRDYGFDEEVKFRIFSDLDDEIRNGVLVEYQGNKYKIIKIICWDDDFLDWMINDE